MVNGEWRLATTMIGDALGVAEASLSLGRLVRRCSLEMPFCIAQFLWT